MSGETLYIHSLNHLKNIYQKQEKEQSFLLGLENSQLIKRREESINNKEDKPTLSGETIKSMSVDKFLDFIQKRINIHSLMIG